MTILSYLSVPLLGMPGWQELMIIGVVVALLFGAKKLPALGKGLGEGILNFKKGIKGEKKGENKDNELAEGDSPADSNDEDSKE